jgi:hypothetical protein
MDYFYFILIILALVAAFIFLQRSDKKTKNRHKVDAYKLLDSPNPAPEEIVKTIKFLRLYGGRWRKDKEFLQLVERLQVRLKLSIEVARQPEIGLFSGMPGRRGYFSGVPFIFSITTPPGYPR